MEKWVLPIVLVCAILVIILCTISSQFDTFSSITSTITLTTTTVVFRVEVFPYGEPAAIVLSLSTIGLLITMIITLAVGRTK